MATGPLPLRIRGRVYRCTWLRDLTPAERVAFLAAQVEIYLPTLPAIVLNSLSYDELFRIASLAQELEEPVFDGEAVSIDNPQPDHPIGDPGDAR